jgi:hypothetical protein
LDNKFSKKAIELINRLKGNEKNLQRNVDNLKCELEELRRRQRKRSTKELLLVMETSAYVARALATCLVTTKTNRNAQSKFLNWPRTISSPICIVVCDSTGYSSVMNVSLSVELLSHQ